MTVSTDIIRYMPAIKGCLQKTVMFIKVKTIALEKQDILQYIGLQNTIHVKIITHKKLEKRFYIYIYIFLFLKNNLFWGANS